MPSIDPNTIDSPAIDSDSTGVIARSPVSSRQLLLTNRLVRAATVLGRFTAQVHKAGFGLSGSEFNVMVVLGDAEAFPLTSSAIVETTAMDKTKVSRAVSSLDRRGWLSRTRAKADRRFEYLELTRDGRRFFDDLMPRLKQAEASILSGMSRQEYDALSDGLAGLDRALNRATGSPHPGILPLEDG